MHPRGVQVSQVSAPGVGLLGHRGYLNARLLKKKRSSSICLPSHVGKCWTVFSPTFWHEQTSYICKLTQLWASSHVCLLYLFEIPVSDFCSFSFSLSFKIDLQQFFIFEYQIFVDSTFYKYFLLVWCLYHHHHVHTLFSIFFKKIFIIWLYQCLVVAHRIFCWGAQSVQCTCGIQA